MIIVIMIIVIMIIVFRPNYFVMKSSIPAALRCGRD